MRIVFFSHPAFLNIRSIARYAQWLSDGMAALGHDTKIVVPEGKYHRRSSSIFLQKWLGYVDSFVSFPRVLEKYVREGDGNTLFVLVDQALGPWVPYLKKGKLVVHCHDFLAQKSADGVYPQNPLSKTGKIYQQYIRNGFAQGKNFICISNKTKQDLLQYLPNQPQFSEVVYNGIAPVFRYKKKEDIKPQYAWEKTGFFLHVGGNQWYKNRLGVVVAYIAFRKKYNCPLPLVLVGEPLSGVAVQAIAHTQLTQDVHLLSNIDDERLCDLYNQTSLFLFPSIAEGFGWPIAEAMQCGASVLTTDDAPMTEVGGEVAWYVPIMPVDTNAQKTWSDNVASKMKAILDLPETEKEKRKQQGIQYVAKFDSKKALEKIEKIYRSILDNN